MIRTGTQARVWGGTAQVPDMSSVLKMGTAHVVTPLGVGVLAAAAFTALCVAISRLPEVRTK